MIRTMEEIMMRNGKLLSPEEIKENQRRYEKECEIERAENEKKEKLRIKRLEESVPPRFKKALDPRLIRSKDIYDELKGGGKDAIIFGPNGTGKTFLGWALCEAVWKAGKTAKLSGCLGMLREIKATYGRDENARIAAYRNYCAPSLLVIDEIDKIHGSQDDLLIIFEVINRRWEYLKATVALVNCEKENLIETVGKAVFSRLGIGGSVYRLAGEDLRGRK